MLQRIQTVYLLLALILTTVCLCLPVGAFVPEGMGTDAVMYNLWTVTPNGGHDLSVCPLFSLLVLTCPICLFAIFAYNKRILQSRLCVLCILLDIAWIAFYAYKGFFAVEEGMAFKMAIAAGLPGVCIILYALARRGILKDERLVRESNTFRIR